MRTVLHSARSPGCVSRARSTRSRAMCLFVDGTSVSAYVLCVFGFQHSRHPLLVCSYACVCIVFCFQQHACLPLVAPHVPVSRKCACCARYTTWLCSLRAYRVQCSHDVCVHSFEQNARRRAHCTLYTIYAYTSRSNTAVAGSLQHIHTISRKYLIPLAVDFACRHSRPNS